VKLKTVETIPLKIDDHGVIRVSNTRVTLDTIIQAFANGATAEEIAYRYPSVPLADIYYVIGYYLRRTEEVDAYLAGRRQVAGQVRQQNELRFDLEGTRARLLARQATAEG